MLVDRLAAKKLELKNSGRNPKGINVMGRSKEERIEQLKDQADDYCEAKGKALIPQRTAQMRLANMRAKQQRLALQKALTDKRITSAKSRYSTKTQGRLASPQTRERIQAMRGTTPVQSSLQPAISRQKIVIPASSRADGNGFGTGTWDNNAEDYMATPPQTTEVYLGADGDKKGVLSKINWKAVGIGAAVGVAAIFIIRKYVKK